MKNQPQNANILTLLKIEELLAIVKRERFHSVGQVFYYHISYITPVLAIYFLALFFKGSLSFLLLSLIFFIVFLAKKMRKIESGAVVNMKIKKNEYIALKKELINDFESKDINPFLAELDKDFDTAVKQHKSIKRKAIAIYIIVIILLVPGFKIIVNENQYSPDVVKPKSFLNANTNNALEKNFIIKPYKNGVGGALNGIFEIDNKEYNMNFNITDNKLYDNSNLYENAFILIPDIRLIQKQEFDASKSVKLIITLTDKDGLPIKNVPDICLNSSPDNKINVEKGLALCNFISYYIDSNKEKTYNKINYLINQDIYFIINSFIVK